MFSPAPSPDGGLVYFLEDSIFDSTRHSPFNRSGAVHALDTATGQDRLVLAGSYAWLALSPDGGRLVAATRNADTTLVVVTDTAGRPVLTLAVPVDRDRQEFGGVRFSAAGDAVYYNVIQLTFAVPDPDTTRFFRRGLTGDTATTLAAESLRFIWTFAVLPGETIVVDTSAGMHMSVNPVERRWTVFSSKSESIFSPWSWRVRDRATGTLGLLRSATLPADMTYLDWPAWCGNGRDMLFVTGSSFGPEGMDKSPGQIWRLDNVMDYRS